MTKTLSDIEYFNENVIFLSWQ